MRLPRGSAQNGVAALALRGMHFRKSGSGVSASAFVFQHAFVEYSPLAFEYFHGTESRFVYFISILNGHVY